MEADGEEEDSEDDAKEQLRLAMKLSVRLSSQNVCMLCMFVISHMHEFMYIRVSCILA